jgi:hypothetical protein
VVGSEAQLRVTGGDPVGELASLWEWLGCEPEMHGRVRRLSKPGAPTDLSGGVAEVLTVALGSGGAAAVLARSLSTWLQTRRASVTLTVSVSGRTASVQARHVDSRQVDEVLGILRDVLADEAGR